MTSQQIMEQKADLAVSELTTAGGVMAVGQAQTFFRKLIAQPTIINAARRVFMKNPKREINKIGFGAPILRKAVSATLLADADRAKPDLGRVTLDTKELMAEVWLPYDALEDNIEGQSMSDTVIDLMVGRAALDLESVIVKGDTASADALLSSFDGVLKQAVSHIVNAGAATLSTTVFKAALKEMPDQFLRDRPNTRFYISNDQETEYRDRLSLRQTGAGDAFLTGAANPVAYGVAVEGMNQMPETDGLLVNPLNIIVGFHREVMLETWKDIRRRLWVIVMTLRVDTKFEEEDGVVKINNLAVA